MIRAHCLRLNLSLGHLEPAKPMPLREPHSAMVLLSQLRYAAPSIAMSWFMLRGWVPAVPIEPRPYDFLVEMPSGVKKVQVKSSTRRDRYGNYQASIAPQRTHGPNKSTPTPYDPDDVDLFFITAADGWLYLIHMAAVAGRTAISLGAYRQFRCGECGWPAG
jgi:hypothetical protein